MFEGIIVAILVTGAAFYSVWALIPGGTRLRLAGWLRRRVGHSATPAPIRRATARLEKDARSRLGGCDGCPASPPDPDETRRD
jgi:hypothetical protein